MWKREPAGECTRTYLTALSMLLAQFGVMAQEMPREYQHVSSYLNKKGDFKALRKHGLDVVAIHHHMTVGRPMIIFLHYWGTGRAEQLATGFRAALDELGNKAARAPMTH